MTNDINTIKQQNDEIEALLKTRGIKFTKLSIDNMDPETEMLIIQTYNKYLNDIFAQNAKI